MSNEKIMAEIDAEMANIHEKLALLYRKRAELCRSIPSEPAPDPVLCGVLCGICKRQQEDAYAVCCYTCWSSMSELERYELLKKAAPSLY